MYNKLIEKYYNFIWSIKILYISLHRLIKNIYYENLF
jgi:hypothetical protein